MTVFPLGAPNITAILALALISIDRRCSQWPSLIAGVAGVTMAWRNIAGFRQTDTHWLLGYSISLNSTTCCSVMLLYYYLCVIRPKFLQPPPSRDQISSSYTQITAVYCTVA
jgi:NADH:ubiquinone oxidoreductase subunit 2 (subunit N)